MFADNTLTPKEALRVCALGTVASGPLRYGALADAVRHFCGRIMGPSIDLMGTSIELLRYEGLVEAVEGDGDEALLAITESGRSTLLALLTARLRPSTDLTKLVVALKFRFLPLLDPPRQAAQIDMLMDVTESELARFEDLLQSGCAEAPDFGQWLEHEIAQSRARLDWLENFRDRLSA